VASTESFSSNAGNREGPIILQPFGGALGFADEVILVAALGRGCLIAFPTDTVYGVGANAGNRRAIRRLFEAKQRPSAKPLPVLIPDRDALTACARIVPAAAWALAEAFWPGPLTIILPRSDAICAEAVAGGDTVGLRVPDHPVALQVLRAVGGPMAVTSANLSGEESTVSGAEVLRSLGPWLEVLIDAESPGSGLPSTVLDLTTSPPCLLRRGALTVEELASVIGEIAWDREPAP